LSEGYSQTLVYNGYGTASMSYGAPHELNRVVEVKYMFDCIVAHNTVASSTLTDLDYIANIDRKIVRSGHGSARGTGDLFAHRVNAGGTITYDLNKLPSYNYEGAMKGNVAFYTSSSSSDTVSIAVNGVVIKTLSLTTSPNLINIVEFDMPFNVEGNNEVSPVITISNTSDTAPAYVICANLYKLNAIPSKNISLDYFRVFDSTRSFRSNAGASDYAILEDSSNLFCGSYHGGETSLQNTLKLDGITQDNTRPTGEFSLFNQCELLQQTNIISKLTSTVTHNFVDNGYDISVRLQGSLVAKKLFTCMATTNELFLYTNQNIDLTSLADGDKVNIFGNSITQKTAGLPYAPSLYSSVSFDFFDNSANSENGAYILKSTGNYNKVYYAPILDTPVEIKDIFFKSSHRFDD
jgi:hypothetical protein